MKKNRVIVRAVPGYQYPDSLQIFFNDASMEKGFLMNWDSISGHGNASIEFYRKCKRINKNIAEDFLKTYCELNNCNFYDFQLREKLDYSVL